MEQVEEYEGDAASAADPAAGALKAKQISFVGGDVGMAAAAAAEDAAKPHPFAAIATQPATGGGGGANVSFAASGELLNLAEAGAERTPSGSLPNVVSVVSVAEGGVAHGIVLPGDVLLAIGETAVGPHATHEIATAVIKVCRAATATTTNKLKPPPPPHHHQLTSAFPPPPSSRRRRAW